MSDFIETNQTVLVPVTALVRLPLPSKEERAELVTSLEHASAQIKSGEYTVFEKNAFADWMMAAYRGQSQEK